MASKLFLLIGVLLFIGSSYGGIFPYDNYELSQDVIRIGMFSPKDSPADSSPGNGNSFVKIDVVFTRETDSTSQTSTQADILLFHSDASSAVGILASDGKRHFCCSQELAAANECTEVGKIVIHQENTAVFRHIPLAYITGDTITISQVLPIEESGIYYFMLINCPDSHVGIVRATGEVVFMNPYGYLPGELYPYLPFYGTIALLYVAVGIGWLFISYKYRNVILPLQKWIGGVIALGMIETATLYFYDLGYNISGENYVAAMMVGVIFSTVKRTISRILVLVVSMGYGVVKPTLGEEKTKVILLGALYFLFSGTLNIVELVQRTKAFTATIVVLLVFPVALLDTGFYWWIFLSLLKTIQQLTVRRQPIKLTMYRRFFGTLGFSGLVSSVIIVVQVIISMTYDQDKLWRSVWVWNAFWHTLYFIILIAIIILWRPTENNSRYAYSEMPQEEEIALSTLSSHILEETKEDEENHELGVQAKLN